MNGWDFRTEQARDPELAAIPVVVVSAYWQRQQDKALGPVAFLSKPLAVDQLVGLMDVLISEARAKGRAGSGQDTGSAVAFGRHVRFECRIAPGVRLLPRTTGRPGRKRRAGGSAGMAISRNVDIYAPAPSRRTRSLLAVDGALLDTAAIARRLGFARDSVGRLFRRGLIPGAVKVGGRWRIHETHLDRYFELRTPNPCTPDTRTIAS
jgi:CheY-like chemotaxis protein